VIRLVDHLPRAVKAQDVVAHRTGTARLGLVLVSGKVETDGEHFAKTIKTLRAVYTYEFAYESAYDLVYDLVPKLNCNRIWY
jgi:hypothetical protein